MNRRDFVTQLTAVSALSALSNNALAATTKRPPNIVFMLVDDLGWGDFGCYGDTFHETPHIDQLARDGMKFTSAYANACICSPSRGAIMTGQSPARTHLTDWIPGMAAKGKKLNSAPFIQHLPAGIPTIASELKKQGYRTGAVGKWHLGGEGFLPENFGFDTNYGGDDHGHPSDMNHYFGPYEMHNLGGYTEKDYLTDVLTTKVDAFLEDAAPKGPFFLYFAEYAVHEPLEEREAAIAKYSKKNGGHEDPDPTYAAMVESVDAALGKLRKKLTDLGVADNTIIFLTSDNGGVRFAEDKFKSQKLHRVADNGPFRGGKGDLYEGGIREPLLVYWPGVTKPGSVTDVPVYGVDYMPTILSITNGSHAPAPCDGIDISSVLRSGATPQRDALYWHYPHYSPQGGTPTGVIREGDWKLIEFFEDEHLELYNLSSDPGEQYDFSAIYPARAKQMRTKLADWRDGIHANMTSPNPTYDAKQTAAFRSPPTCAAHPELQNCIED